jgi:hypothetical protein
VAREVIKKEDVTKTAVIQPKGECDQESDLPCSCPRRRFVEPSDKLPMPAAASNMQKTVGGSEDDKNVIAKQKVDNTKLKAKVKEVQSTHQASLTELETKFTSVVTAEAPEPAVATEAAHQMEATSETPEEPAAPTPVAVEEAHLLQLLLRRNQLKRSQKRAK